MLTEGSGDLCLSSNPAGGPLTRGGGRLGRVWSSGVLPLSKAAVSSSLLSPPPPPPYPRSSVSSDDLLVVGRFMRSRRTTWQPALHEPNPRGEQTHTHTHTHTHNPCAAVDL